MRRLLLTLMGVSCLSAGTVAQEPSKEDKIFSAGLNAGMISKYEGEVVDSFNGILFLTTLPEAEPYRRILVTRMNGALLALSFVDRDVTIRPAILKDIAKISSPNMKPFMTQVRQQRIEKKWRLPDSKQEASVGRILDRYIKTGNAYGFE